MPVASRAASSPIGSPPTPYHSTGGARDYSICRLVALLEGQIVAPHSLCIPKSLPNVYPSSVIGHSATPRTCGCTHDLKNPRAHRPQRQVARCLVGTPTWVVEGFPACMRDAVPAWATSAFGQSRESCSSRTGRYPGGRRYRGAALVGVTTLFFLIAPLPQRVRPQRPGGRCPGQGSPQCDTPRWVCERLPGARSCSAWNHYQIPLDALGDTRIVYRDKFGSPDLPEEMYVAPFPDGWWFDEEKAARISF